MTDFEARGRHVQIAAELRAEDDGGVLVEGYAAVFNEVTSIGDYFEEVIAPGAFADAIGRDDVVFLVDHAGLPLARTTSGTLELSEDAHGLKVRTRLDPDDRDAASIISKMRRGDMSKMSFAFWPERETWDETGDIPRRTIEAARLRDVSIVIFPAYEGTEIGLRSLAAARAEARQATAGAAARRRMKSRFAARA